MFMSDSLEQDLRHFSMADVGHKAPTRRRALARGAIRLGPDAFRALREGRLPKGDPFAMATPGLLPLCHPISLDRVSLHHRLDEPSGSAVLYALAEITERTGVEMEALTGLSVALLTVWDLVKPVEPALEIEGVRLLFKSGGKRGDWIHPAGLSTHARSLLGFADATDPVP
jgi:molybdenum cofactor biosynthesis protein MoaC